MKNLARLLCVLCLSTAAVAQNPPTGYYKYAIYAPLPNGSFVPVSLDTANELLTLAGAGHTASQTPPVGMYKAAVYGLKPDGSFVPLSLDSSGALIVTGGGGGGTPATSVVSSLTALLGPGVVLAAYMHADCTNPYKDYSGNGNDGTVAAGVTQPACSAQGLQYYTVPTVVNGWALPAAVSTAALSYATRLCPYLSPTAGNNGGQNGLFLASSATNGLVLSLLGYVTNHNDAYAPTIGMMSGFATTSSPELLQGCTTDIFNLGSSASDLDQIFVNGVQPTYAAQGFSGPNRTNGTLTIGASTTGALANASYFGIETGLLAFSRKLTPSEAQAVTGILRDYATQIGSPDVPFPTYSATPTIACGVDSQTYGQGVPNSWCSSALMTGLNETVNITKAPAVQGQFMAAAAARVVPVFQPFFAANAPHNTAMLMGCTNDLASQPTINCVPFVANATYQLRQHSWKVIALPMLDRTGLDAAKNTFNTTFRAQCPTFADGCVGDSDPELYADGASSNTDCFQDGVHPTTACDTLIATYAQNTYNKLYGSTSVNPVIISTTPHTLAAAESYAIMTVNGSLVLPNCLGYTGSWTVKSGSTLLVISVTAATSAQTIDGADHSTSPLALVGNSTTIFNVILGPTSTGGCTWSTGL